MIQLLICGMRREQYLPIVLDSWGTHHPDLFGSHLQYHDDDHLGMAGAISTAWEQVLEYTDWDYLLHAEEDMELLRPLPLDRARQELEKDRTLAQMLFPRAPWWGSQPEMETGSVLGAIHQVSTEFHQRRSFATYDHIFSLNPCLIPRRVVELGWDAGNEAGQTFRLLTLGYRFACWGRPDTPPPTSPSRSRRWRGSGRRGSGWSLGLRRSAG